MAYMPSGLTPTSFSEMQLGAGAFFVGIDSGSLSGHQSDLDQMQYAPCKIFFFDRDKTATV